MSITTTYSKVNYQKYKERQHNIGRHARSLWMTDQEREAVKLLLNALRSDKLQEHLTIEMEI
jgi:hypothetical protein